MYNYLLQCFALEKKTFLNDAWNGLIISKLKIKFICKLQRPYKTTSHNSQ